MADNKALPTQDEIYKLVRENNRMLKAMRRDAFIGGIFKIVWWVVVLVVLPYLTYLYLKPYLDGALAAYSQIQQQGESVNAAISGLPDFSKLFEQFGLGKAK